MLFVGDDWAEDHHDVELMNPTGKRVARARLPEGVDGIARFHALVAEHSGTDTPAADVGAGIETDRGPWVAALIAAGYSVFAVNPLQAARYRQRHAVSGAKSDPADAHVLAGIANAYHSSRPWPTRSDRDGRTIMDTGDSFQRGLPDWHELSAAIRHLTGDKPGDHLITRWMRALAQLHRTRHISPDRAIEIDRRRWYCGRCGGCFVPETKWPDTLPARRLMAPRDYQQRLWRIAGFR
nr:transposase [Nocardia abscessus]